MVNKKEDKKKMPKFSYDRNKQKKPKRNKSAFIIFSIQAREKLKALNKDSLNSNEIMVQIADLWKNLSKEEINFYKQEAAKDKKRYQQELKLFEKENPSQLPHNKTKNNHIKKPSSAYGLFLSEMKNRIKGQDPDLKMAGIMKIVAEKWRNLDEKDKAIYQERANKEKQISRQKLLESSIKNEPQSKKVTTPAKKKVKRHNNEISIKCEDIKDDICVKNETLVDCETTASNGFLSVSHKKSFSDLFASNSPSTEVAASDLDQKGETDYLHQDSDEEEQMYFELKPQKRYSDLSKDELILFDGEMKSNSLEFDLDLKFSDLSQDKPCSLDLDLYQSSFDLIDFTSTKSSVLSSYFEKHSRDPETNPFDLYALQTHSRVQKQENDFNSYPFKIMLLN